MPETLTPRFHTLNTKCYTTWERESERIESMREREREEMKQGGREAELRE
jgi:hypothetical protein